MPNLEERVHALERESVMRKKAEKLLTIAIHALVSKEAFEKLQDTVEKSQEQNNKLFDVLNNHNVLTNERLGNIQDQIIALDGKTVGLQAEMRQRLTELDNKIVGQQTETRQRFIELDNKIIGQQTEMHQRFIELDSKIVGQQTEMRQRLTEQTTLLQQILTCLPEKP